MKQIKSVAVQHHEAGWSDRPNRTDIRKTCGSRVYAQGERHYDAGHIIDAHIRGNEINATVTGREEYPVSIRNVGMGRLDCSCFCADYFMTRSLCEHMAAVLLYLADHYDEMREEEEDDLNTLKYIMTLVPPERISAFLTDILATDEEERERFVNKFGLRGVRHPDANLMSLRRMFRHAAEFDGKVRQNLDLADQFGEARKTRDDGNAMAAARLYQDISSVVYENMGAVEDATGYYQDCLIEALECMTESIVREEMPSERKQEYISYLFERTVDSKGAKLAPHYRDALSTICTTKEDLEFWLNLSSSLAQDSAADNKDVVRMRVQILEKLGRPREALELLEGLYLSDSGLCVTYLSILRDGAGQESVEMAIKAAAAFPTDTGVLDAALSILGPGSTERAAALGRLFGITDDWKYFFMLKRESANWDEARESLIESLISNKAVRLAVDIYIKEAMHKEAMDMLELVGDLEIFPSYMSNLAKKYPKRYLAAYGHKIVSFSKRKTGKAHQGRVKDHLSNLKNLPDSNDQYKETLSCIQNDSRGRRLIQNILGSLSR